MTWKILVIKQYKQHVKRLEIFFFKIPCLIMNPNFFLFGGEIINEVMEHWVGGIFVFSVFFLWIAFFFIFVIIASCTWWLEFSCFLLMFYFFGRTFERCRFSIYMRNRCLKMCLERGIFSKWYWAPELFIEKNFKNHLMKNL